MSDRREAERPSVVIGRHIDAFPGVLREVCAGAEEEGVPTRVEPAGDREVRDAAALAHSAALASGLEVGVGIDAGGIIAVHHAKLPPGAPAHVTSPGAGPPDWRRAGQVAARIVTGLPIAP
ncbi:glycerol dehydratase reactivase beta/small subunit family protein [Pseudonocardia bannensis]|uniref:PduH protein n=1 Tax=Pseudonocardia bannensis TaxID=630973 RepID=A0A848DFN8_9PSEU|nr:glycerol dehydratase reactivase beta/small subunit family protein [Pseudonocardia bannensis]NMH91385.1 PduH protein [Pseudonocardia bannensis]